jgi:hypothetical protein
MGLSGPTTGLYGKNRPWIRGLELLGVRLGHTQRGLPRRAVDLVGSQQLGGLAHECGGALEHVDGGIGGAQGCDQRPGGGDRARSLWALYAGQIATPPGPVPTVMGADTAPVAVSITDTVSSRWLVT